MWERLIHKDLTGDVGEIAALLKKTKKTGVDIMWQKMDRTENGFSTNENVVFQAFDVD